MCYVVADHSFFFLLLGEHDDGRAFLFPDHPPEIILCVWQGALRGNELSDTMVALSEIGKEILASVLAMCNFQTHVNVAGIDVV